MSKRKKCTPEYRREAAALVLDTDRPIARVAAEIDVGAQLLGRWAAQERERRDPPPGPGAVGGRREELGIRRSVGHSGVCWNNPVAESFRATLKKEFSDRHSWPIQCEALEGFPHARMTR